MSLPLEGVRVVEVAQYVAGPLCGLLLAELGADVIKVEPPAGDAYRQVMPVAPGSAGTSSRSTAARGRSCSISRRTPAGRGWQALVGDGRRRRPQRTARPRADVRARLGRRCTRPTHASSSGSSPRSARTGPLAGRARLRPRRAGRAPGCSRRTPRTGDAVPVRAGGIPMADLTAGHLLATGVLAALVRRAAQGRGQLRRGVAARRRARRADPGSRVARRRGRRRRRRRGDARRSRGAGRRDRGRRSR